MQLAVPTNRDLATVQCWLQDPECRKRLGGLLPLRTFLAHVRSRSNYWLWVANEDRVPVALAGFEVGKRGDAAVLLAVDPDKRNLGYGRRALRLLMHRPEAGRVRQFIASAETDNEPALRCFEAAGFVDCGPEPDEPGFQRLVLSRVPRTGATGAP